MEILSEESPELILMDLAMPVRGGIEATRLIRKTVENSDVVIMASTVLPCSKSRQRTLAAWLQRLYSKATRGGTIVEAVSTRLWGIPSLPTSATSAALSDRPYCGCVEMAIPMLKLWYFLSRVAQGSRIGRPLDFRGDPWLPGGNRELDRVLETGRTDRKHHFPLGLLLPKRSGRL